MIASRKHKPDNPQRDTCRLCGEPAVHIFSAKVLGKHEVGYFHCNQCGLIQTEEPYWLEEAYSRAVSSADTGIMARNLYYMKTVAVLIRLMGMHEKAFLDYGGGHGVFTRLMRDQGLDFRWWDPRAENLFCRGFEGAPDGSYGGVTALEVLEHLHQPRRFFDCILGQMQPDVLFVSTETVPERVNEDWHYFYFPTGQHIAFYESETLRMTAREYGYNCCGVSALYVFSKRKIPEILLKFCVRAARYIHPLMRMDSLVIGDHHEQMNEMGTGSAQDHP